MTNPVAPELAGICDRIAFECNTVARVLPNMPGDRNDEWATRFRSIAAATAALGRDITHQTAPGASDPTPAPGCPPSSP